MSSTSGSSTNHQIVKQLLKLNKADGGSGVYISNGFLALVETDDDLIGLFNTEEKAFFDESLKQYDDSLQQQYDANQENVDALAKAEKLAQELRAQKVELEKAKSQAEKNTDDARQELREQAQVALQADRQKAQFLILKQWWAPAIFLISMVLLIGCFWLAALGKDNDNMLLILGTCLGTLFTSFSVSNSSVYTPLVREESKGDGNKQANPSSVE